MSFAPNHDFPHFDLVTAAARTELAGQATPTQKAERFAELVTTSKNAAKTEKVRREAQYRWLAEKVRVRLRQIGGLAASIRGRVRATEDLDLILMCSFDRGRALRCRA